MAEALIEAEHERVIDSQEVVADLFLAAYQPDRSYEDRVQLVAEARNVAAELGIPEAETRILQFCVLPHGRKVLEDLVS